MKTILIAAALAAGFAATPAFAQTGGEQRIAISHADLDLATEAGRATLDLRLLHAARAACGTPSPADALGVQRADACLAELRTAAAAQRDAIIAVAMRRTQPALASR